MAGAVKQLSVALPLVWCGPLCHLGTDGAGGRDPDPNRGLPVLRAPSVPAAAWASRSGAASR